MTGKLFLKGVALSCRRPFLVASYTLQHCCKSSLKVYSLGIWGKLSNSELGKSWMGDPITSNTAGLELTLFKWTVDNVMRCWKEYIPPFIHFRGVAWEKSTLLLNSKDPCWPWKYPPFSVFWERTCVPTSTESGSPGHFGPIEFAEARLAEPGHVVYNDVIGGNPLNKRALIGQASDDVIRGNTLLLFERKLRGFRQYLGHFCPKMTMFDQTWVNLSSAHSLLTRVRLCGAQRPRYGGFHVYLI